MRNHGPRHEAVTNPYLALFAVCLAAAAMPLTFTGTAVALPSIAQTLDASPVATAWATNAFMLTFGSTLMVAGALADSLGRRRIFLLGAASFALFSLALTVVPDILLFDLLRGGQGLAAAAAYAGGAAALAQEFDGARRMRAFSVLGTSFGVGLSLGPVVSGAMIESLGWRSIFLAVVLLTSLSFLIGYKVLKESRDPAAGRLDWRGALGFTTMLALFTYGMLLVPERGWSDGLVVVALIGSAVCLVLFIQIERTVARPMLDLSLFRYRRFVGVQLLAAAPAYGFVVLLVLLPLRFVGIEGMGAIAGGGLMIALSAPLLILPIVAGWLTRWLRPATLCGTGLIVTACGLGWLSTLPSGTPAALLLLPMLMIGTGISLPWGLMDGLAVDVVPSERAGMAMGIFSTVRVAGEGVALAVIGAILSLLIAGRLSAAGLQGSAQTAGQNLAIGNLEGALAALPGSTASQLQSFYSQAFSSVLILLSAITTITAIVVFLSLNQAKDGAIAAKAL